MIPFKTPLLNFLISVGFLLGLSGCEPILWNDLVYGDITGEIWTSRDAHPIRMACTKDCRTIALGPARFNKNQNQSKNLSQAEQQIIHSFLRHYPRQERVYLAPCEGPYAKDPEVFEEIQKIGRAIAELGYPVAITRPVFSATKKTNNRCVNLLKGRLILIPPQCPNTKRRSSIYRMNSDFSCSSAHNLAVMMDNPWDLIRASGDVSTPATSIAHANLDYNSNVQKNMALAELKK